MKKAMIAALLGATLLTGGAVAAAQDHPNPQEAARPGMMHDSMMMADVNHDGVITRDEFVAGITARFAKLDADKDGKITREERRAARQAMRGGMGDRMRGGPDGPGGPRGPGGPGGPGRPKMMHGPDANGDGVITLDEQRARALRHFDFVDRNGDGKIDQAERDLVHEMMGEMMREMGGGRHGPRGPGGPGGPHHGGDMPAPPAPPANGS